MTHLRLRFTPRWITAIGAFLTLLAVAGQSASTTPAGSSEEPCAGEPAIARDASTQKERGEHLARIGVDQWQSAGVRGKGVKVAIIDSGFRGYRNYLGKALPDRVTARSFRYDADLEAKDSQHGILCGEVVHALAPDAELLLANWEPDSPDTFLAAVQWARDKGARVISCSVIMPSWSDGEGGGPIHEKLAKLLGQGKNAGDILCFASAGNTAERTWSGKFHAGTDGCHEWLPGKTDNLLRPWGSTRVTLELCCQTATTYDLQVIDDSTSRPVGAEDYREPKAPANHSLRFDPEPNHQYRVRVQLKKGEPGPFHLVALGSGLSYSTTRGSVCFPADGPSVLAVGAVDYDGHRAAYSSCGPNSSMPKPDLVAPVPFPSLWRDRPFAGTSAAAPQAAGIAALLWSQHPDWTASQLRSTLQKSARDLGPVGHDCETGYGLVRLPTLDKLLSRSLRTN
jgi:subtilisin family serine protease